MELSVTGLRAASLLARHLPLPVTTGSSRLLSLAAARLSREQRLMAERNLHRTRPERYRGTLARARLQHDVQRVFDSYARYWVDSLRLPDLSTAAVGRGFTVEGLERVEAALDDGIGPILALPHVGGWEWAARWLHSVRGWTVAAVAEQLEPPELTDWFLDLRRGLGMHIIPLDSAAAAESTKAIAAGEILCLLCDRDLTGAGVEVEFFGETTKLPAGPALLALRSGAPLLPTAVYFHGNRCHGVIGEPLDTERRDGLRKDVVRVTQDLATTLEAHIRRAPTQWHLLQPNWPSDYVALGRPVPGEA